MQRAILKFRKNQQEGVRPDLLGAVYHGGCLGCPHLAGNDTHEGIEWCLGCSYSNFNESLPSLMQRRKQSIDLSVGRGVDVTFGSHLLSDCSPFTEWVWRNIKGTRND